MRVFLCARQKIFSLCVFPVFCVCVHLSSVQKNSSSFTSGWSSSMFLWMRSQSWESEMFESLWKWRPKLAYEINHDLYKYEWIHVIHIETKIKLYLVMLWPRQREKKWGIDGFMWNSKYELSKDREYKTYNMNY